MVFTVRETGGSPVMLIDREGRYLAGGDSGGLSLTAEPGDNRLSQWQLILGRGGCCLRSAGTRTDQAIEYYGSRFTTYRLELTEVYLFNFCEVTDADGE